METCGLECSPTTCYSDWGRIEVSSSAHLNTDPQCCGIHPIESNETFQILKMIMAKFMLAFRVVFQSKDYFYMTVCKFSASIYLPCILVRGYCVEEITPLLSGPGLHHIKHPLYAAGYFLPVLLQGTRF